MRTASRTQHAIALIGTASLAVPIGAVVLFTVAGGTASARQPQDTSGLVGTSWRLVSIQGSGEKALIPSDETSYTIDFQADGRLRARVDCNGGRGRWTSPAPGRLEFGTLGLTREKCKPGSLHDRIVQDWRLIRMYTIKANHLFLTVSGGKGTYEFRPLPPKEPVTTAVAAAGPFTYDCNTPSGNRAGTLQATLYQTQPAMMLVERDGRTRPAFAVPSAKGTKYEAKELVFSEVGGEASIVWSGITLVCRRR